MNQLNDLAALDLLSLSEMLATGTPMRSELDPGQWLAVVELLTMRLAEGCGDVPTERWAMCSAALDYALETAVSSGAIDRREGVIRRLNLSVALLPQIPSSPEVDILNPEHLIELLFRELPMSAEEARQLSSGWRSLHVSQIRRLRVAKNLVTPALSLARLMSEEEFAERLREWEEVLPSLP
ncbi:hypothetical protein [Streptomyces sp. UG1]|uniref:hypothetical protein n=1 Tax=Streptomyces sp. UG1 TaxID=3417652 RepID=UPI003CF6D708